MPSTRDLAAMPSIEDLRRLMQSLAILDAIICPKWEFRYYSFNSHWSDEEMVGSMRDGSGDDFFVAFNFSGCFIKGFVHESAMSPYEYDPPTVFPGVLDEVPVEFEGFRKEPAFGMSDTTFCIWRRFIDTSWSKGNVSYPNSRDPDGSEGLLSLLDGRPEAYTSWADGYYELESQLNVSDIAQVYRSTPLSVSLVHSINPEREISGLIEDAIEIGYQHEL